MTITDYFIKERSDQNLPYHNLSAILSYGRQFEALYIEYVLRNWRAQSFLDAELPRQYSMIQEYFETFSGRLSVVTLLLFFLRIPRQSRTQSPRLTNQTNPRQADGADGGGRTKGQAILVPSM